MGDLDSDVVEELCSDRRFLHPSFARLMADAVASSYELESATWLVCNIPFALDVLDAGDPDV